MKKTLLIIGFLMLFFTSHSFSSENKFPEMDFYQTDEAISLLTEHLSNVDPEFVQFLNIYNQAYIIEIVFLRKVLNEDNEGLNALAFVNLIKNTTNKTHEEFILFARNEIHRIADLLINNYVFDQNFVKYKEKQDLLWAFLRAYDFKIMNQLKSQLSIHEKELFKEIMKIENPTPEDFSRILFQPLVGKTIKEFIENQ